MVRDVPSDLFIMFSTAPGEKADDELAGSRNSPFAKAFLTHIASSEPVVVMAADVAHETMNLTGDRQRPFMTGSIVTERRYSLNPAGARPTTTVQPTPVPQPAPTPTPANMVRINGGTFTMGDSNNGTRQVTVSSFYMGRTEVTQREYEEVTGHNPSNFKGANLPVENVTWFDAVEYCNRKSQKEGLTPAYTITGRTPASGYPITAATVTWNRGANGYRLPTEAEWEYACRAGTTTPYHSGTSVDAAGWYEGNSGGQTQPVGLKQPNSWGLYDMHGNVWEWCWDWYGNYPNTAQTDPAGALSGSYRMRRGGSWVNSSSSATSAYRISLNPHYWYYYLGFRVSRP
jgi:formylglycine-generating enzyme required for sulfatase activity